MRRFSAAFCVSLVLLLGCVALASGATRPTREPVFFVALRSTSSAYDYAGVEVHPRAGVAVLVASRGDGRADRRHTRGAAYAVRISVSADDLGPLEITFGQHGSIEGEVVLAPGRREPVFRGSIQLHAPAGLLDAESGHAEVFRSREPRSDDPSSLYTYVPDVGGFSNYDDPILFGQAERAGRFVELLAARGRLRPHLARFVAAAFEPESGEVAGTRWVEVAGAANSTFATPSGKRPTSATLNPPEPFSGSARWSHATDSLRGSLAVALPGLEVALAGKDTKARLCDYFTVARHPCR